MSDGPKSKAAPASLKYRRVEVRESRRADAESTTIWSRAFCSELKTLPAGSAMKIPFADVGGIGLANLRSAVHRAVTSQGLPIETLADDKNLYVWKTDSSGP